MNLISEKNLSINNLDISEFITFFAYYKLSQNLLEPVY